MSIKGDTGRAVRSRLGLGGSLKAASLLMAAAIVGLSTTGCAKINGVVSMFKFKQANQAYQSQDYERSSKLYEETIASDPNNSIVYFYLGNSYDNMYKPGEKGKPQNDALIQKAVQNYQLAVEKLDANDPVQGKIKALALQFLMAAYGSDKRTYVQKGLVAIDQAINLKPDYMEALVYKGLLLRSQALLEKDPAKQQALIKQAEALKEKADAIRKQKATGVGD